MNARYQIWATKKEITGPAVRRLFISAIDASITYLVQCHVQGLL